MFYTSLVIRLQQWWGNFLTGRLVGGDGWSDLLAHLIGEKISGIVENVWFNFS